ncbi:MAG: 2OG-Fe(II) oxygenase [Planctomyces sp.]|jgi:hypothetical protein
MENIQDKLFIVKDFLFSETCGFLVDNFSKNLKDTGQPGIFRGPVGHDNHKSEDAGINKNASSVSGINKIIQKTEDINYNIAIDIFTSTCTNIEKTVSNIFKKNLLLKSYFYSHMKSGGLNRLHMDNYSEGQSEDFSAILYLSDNYEGGLINFPKLKTELKPNAGTLIAFVGNEELEHEVKEVVFGERINIICFLSERRDNEN